MRDTLVPALYDEHVIVRVRMCGTVYGCGWTYLRDVLALELGKQGREALLIGLDADGAEDFLDVALGGGGVAGEAEEEVGCEVLHFVWVCVRQVNIPCDFLFGGFEDGRTVGVVFVL